MSKQKIIKKYFIILKKVEEKMNETLEELLV